MDAFKAVLAHDPRDPLAPDPDAGVAQIIVDARRAVGAARRGVEAADLLGEHLIGELAR